MPSTLYLFDADKPHKPEEFLLDKDKDKNKEKERLKIQLETVPEGEDGCEADGNENGNVNLQMSERLIRRPASEGQEAAGLATNLAVSYQSTDA